MQNALEKWERKKMSKKEIVVWEKNTETNEVKKVTLKQILSVVNNQNAMEEMPLEYFINKKDITWATIIGVIILIAILLKHNQECGEVGTIKY